MAEPQATREKEGEGKKLLFQASHLLIHPNEIFAVFPVMLGLVGVCSKILSCSFRENGNFGDAADQGRPSFPRRKKNNGGVVQCVFPFGNGEEIN